MIKRLKQSKLLIIWGYKASSSLRSPHHPRILIWHTQRCIRNGGCQIKLLSGNFFRDTSGFLTASVERRDQMLMWLSSSQKNRRGLERDGYKGSIRSHLRGSHQGNYKLYESTQQKVEEDPPKEWIDRRRKLLFPLCLRFIPPLTRNEAAMDGGGLLQEASWGFCGEANRNEGERSALPVFLPFIKAANLWPLYNDQSSPSLHGPSWWKDEEHRDEDEGNRNEDHAISIGVWYRIL